MAPPNACGIFAPRNASLSNLTPAASSNSAMSTARQRGEIEFPIVDGHTAGTDQCVPKVATFRDSASAFSIAFPRTHLGVTAIFFLQPFFDALEHQVVGGAGSGFVHTASIPPMRRALAPPPA